MKFTVIWKPVAEAMLTNIWSNDQHPAAITAAANAIDKMLATSPSSVGESRETGIRILSVLPLCVYYEVFEQDRRVHVFDVWRVKLR